MKIKIMKNIGIIICTEIIFVDANISILVKI